MAKVNKVYRIHTGYENPRTGEDSPNFDSYTTVGVDVKDAIKRTEKRRLDAGEYIESVELVTVLDE